MDARRLAWFAAPVLVVFTAFSMWVLIARGPLELVAQLQGQPWSVQLLLDLAIALGFALSWMRTDARQRGLPWWPFLLVTLAVGSIGPLAYLVVRGVRPPADAAG
jgi:hypothetical protein